ncbi:MAG: hypothetical protein P8K69_02705, partial [Flavobacteriales bacterium]|nr:hypothetical protein [Flavobacteriales bacterium]
MKKYILYLLIITLLSFTKNTLAQCNVPGSIATNTGSNMTVGLLPNVTQSFFDNISLVDGAYVVALSDDGLLAGAQEIPNGGGFFTLAVWADDTATPELDGISSGSSVVFKLVNGDELYDIEVSSWMGASGDVMVINGISQITELSITFNCGPTYCEDGQWYPPYSGNTGNNMTPFFTTGFTSSIEPQNESAYIVGVTESNLVVGSTEVYGLDQFSIVIWGNDDFTDEIDGALGGEQISLSLVDGSQLYSLSTTFTYTTQTFPTFNDADVALSVCSAQGPFGCTDETAFNYNPSANTNDGSCIPVD